MKAPDHIKGPMKSTVASFPARVERWRWISDHFEKGATFQQMGRVLQVSSQSVQDTLKRGDPSATWHRMTKAGKPPPAPTSHKALPNAHVSLSSTPWDRDGERPALDPRLTMARIVSRPRLTTAQVFIAELRAELEQMRASA